MIIKEISGDLLDEFKKGNVDVLVHGANCFHIMGAGIAGQLAWTYPKVVKADKKTACGDISKLGTLSKTRIHLKKNVPQFVVNMYTQYQPGANFEYLALIEGLKALNKAFGDVGYIIGFPQIGCGIGGGHWEYVKNIINEYTPDLKILIVYYDNGEKTVGQTKIDFKTATAG